MDIHELHALPECKPKLVSRKAERALVGFIIQEAKTQKPWTPFPYLAMPGRSHYHDLIMRYVPHPNKSLLCGDEGTMARRLKRPGQCTDQG